MKGKRRRAQTSAHRVAHDRAAGSGVSPRRDRPEDFRRGGRTDWRCPSAAQGPRTPASGRAAGCSSPVTPVSRAPGCALWLQRWAPASRATRTGRRRAVALRAGARGARGERASTGDVRDGERRRAGDRAAAAGGRPPPRGPADGAALVRATRSSTYATNVMGTVNVLDAVRRRRRRARRGRRHLGQVLREPRVGVGLSRGRSDGRPRPVLQLQGLRRARDRRLPRARSSPRRRARASPAPAPATSSAAATGARTACFPTSCAPSLAGAPIAHPQPRAVRPWQHVLNPLSGYLLLAERLWERPRAARRLELRPAPTTTPARSRWIVERLGDAVGRGAALGARRRAPARTRPSSSSSTRRWPARAGLGAALGPRRRASIAPSRGTAPTATAPTCARRRSGRSARSRLAAPQPERSARGGVQTSS